MSSKKSSVVVPNPNTNRGASTKLSAHKSRVIYANNKTVIIRDLANPSQSIAYTGHLQPATVAKISPSGYYAASADTSGTVRVWDTVGEDNTLKGEYRAISGKINDLEWDGESKRIIAVGDGREKFGHAFMFDTGSSTGEIAGHSKSINSVSIRHQRPFRAATAADDATIVFHTGAPYKYDKTIKTHTKFVQDVRYAPSGDVFVSVGSDYKVFLYDGKTGDTLAEVTDSPHTGSIMAASWSRDSGAFATSSADSTVKLWDAENKKVITTWQVGSDVNSQQVGNAWAETGIVSLSLSGALNVFDPRQSQAATSTITAPQKSITVGAVTESGTFIAGTADGRVYSIDANAGSSSLISGNAHTNFVSGLATSAGNSIYTVGYDDKIREISGGTEFAPAMTSTSTQPKGVAVGSDGTSFVVEVSSIEVFKSNQKVTELATKYSPLSVSVSGSTVAIGGDDSKVHLYAWDGKSLSESTVLAESKGPVSAVSFSPDGTLLAAGDSSGKIALINATEKSLITGRWSFHSARINSLAWTSDSKHCASGSLDTHVYIWSVARPLKNIAIKNAVAGGVNTVAWVDGGSGKTGKLVGSGGEPSVNVWDVTFHA
ncbi:WD40-repeat-containing domain protein [Flagelloscypha sp. PMI_526]|nr:WD40-repeat-containing domain protein [Flagelloscypha sp. PMI_526]